MDEIAGFRIVPLFSHVIEGALMSRRHLARRDAAQTKTISVGSGRN